jgi:hypothetical protein
MRFLPELHKYKARRTWGSFRALYPYPYDLSMAFTLPVAFTKFQFQWVPLKVPTTSMVFSKNFDVTDETSHT